LRETNYLLDGFSRMDNFRVTDQNLIIFRRTAVVCEYSKY
jgi:hypothetical protein